MTAAGYLSIHAIIGKIMKNYGSPVGTVSRLNPEHQLVRQHLIALGQCASFCFGGNFEHHYFNSEKELIQVRKPGESEFQKIFKDDLLQLQKFASPAPFGDLEKEETVFDTSVRAAWEILPENWKYDSLFDLSEVASCFLTQGRKVELQPLKLNIYSPGCFFKRHVDTPTNPAMIGTLVVWLPSPFTGGELVVEHAGKTQVFDVGSKCNDPNTWPFAMFLGDCLHEVKPVVSGTRITLTFGIVLKPKVDGKLKGTIRSKKRASLGVVHPAQPMRITDICAGPTHIDIVQENLTNLQHALERLKTPKVGLFLAFGYTSHGLLPENLKATDALLWRALNKRFPGQCQLMQIVRRHYKETPDENGVYSKADLRFEHTVFKFDPDEIERLKSVHVDESYPDQPATTDSTPFILGLDDGEIMRHDSERAGYTGNYTNPGRSDTMYFHAAIIVSLANPQAPLRLTEEDVTMLQNQNNPLRFANFVEDVDGSSSDGDEDDDDVDEDEEEEEDVEGSERKRAKH